MTFAQNGEHCHYLGELLNTSHNTWAAISTCNQSISGVFTDGLDLYHIHPKEDTQLVYLFRDSDSLSSFKCGIV